MIKPNPKAIFFKTPNNFDRDHESNASAYVETMETKTQQHQKQEADINEIVRRFGVTGKLPAAPLPPSLEEFGETFDFMSAMNQLNAAKQAFMALPAEIRNAYNNNPHQYVAHVDSMLNEPDQAQREKNLEVMRAMGMAVTPGPKADKTTLGDILAALKEQTAPGGISSPRTPETAPKTP